MPIKSDAQRKLMYATINDAATGVPKSVAQDFINNTPKHTFKKVKAQLSKVMK